MWKVPGRLMGRESLDRLMKAKLRGAIKTYLRTKAELDASDAPSEKLCDKERLQRGIVRGQAMMLLTFLRPSQHSLKDEVEDVEQEFGFPHTRERARVSPTMKAATDRLYDE